jgi:hypothetical protein
MSTELKESQMQTHLASGDVLSIAPKAYERRWKILAVLSLALLIIGLDNTILNVALPSLQDEFDASATSSRSWGYLRAPN